MFCHSEVVSGERGVKYAVHRLVHPAVHYDGQCKLHMTRRMRTTQWVTLYVAKTVIWAGATPLCCHVNRGGRSSPAYLGPPTRSDAP